MKKFLKIILISIGTVAGLIGLTLATTTIVNVVASNSEAESLQPYGELVSVDGKNMNVVIRGTGSETIVLLPGLGTTAPALDFEPLIAELENDYRVIAIEPFGTGLSDLTDVERTTANIVSEVHEALQALDVDSYILMGHSIAGIYALDYVNTYPNEVMAFVGIDSSVPTQPGSDEAIPTEGMQSLKDLGIFRVLTAAAPDPYEGLAYSDAMKEQMRILTLRNSFNPTLTNELANTPHNFAAARSQTFPKDLPLLLFVLNEDDVPGWVALHEEQAAQSATGMIVLMESSHYLHHTESKEIAETLTRFRGQVETAPTS